MSMFAPASCRLSILFVLLCVLVFAGELRAQSVYSKLAPFTDVVWNPDGSPRVEIDGEWYTLRSIDGHDTGRLVEFGDEEFRGDGRKRFAEDLVELMTKFGAEPGPRVTLVVVHHETGVRRTMQDVPMLAGNRAEVLMNRRERERPRAERDEQPRPDPWAQVLQPEQLKEDIDQFESLLKQRFAYLDRDRRARLRIDAALQALRERAERPMVGRTLGISLQRIIGMTIDGHAGIGGVTGLLADRALPVLFQETDGGRVIAFRGDRSGLVVEGFPYVTHIQGAPIDVWTAAAMRVIPDGSPALVQRRALGLLRSIEGFASAVSVTIEHSVTLTLVNDAGESTTHEVTLGDAFPLYGTWPSRLAVGIPEGIEYLRLPTFSGSGAERAMGDMIDGLQERDDCVGLIIDVRGNRGGNRSALLELLPTLLDPATEPVYVFNVARALRACPEMEREMSGRGLVELGDSSLTDDVRERLREFEAAFDPEWTGDDSKFQSWHYGVVVPDARERRVDVPIVVLMDGFCFSAADVFLSALKGRPGVTLLGMPSGGGSGASAVYELAHSGFSVRLSRMASYQRDGRLFDGVGVVPDVVHGPTPEDLLGTDDSALRRAIELLSGDAGSD